AGRLHHQLEASGCAEAVDGGHSEDVDPAIQNLRLKPPPQLCTDGIGAQRGVSPFFKRFEYDEHAAKVGANAVQDEGTPRIADRVGHSRRLPGNSFDVVGDLLRPFQRGGVGQLNVDVQPTFVLRRNEAAGNP